MVNLARVKPRETGQDAIELARPLPNRDHLRHHKRQGSGFLKDGAYGIARFYFLHALGNEGRVHGIADHAPRDFQRLNDGKTALNERGEIFGDAGDIQLLKHIAKDGEL